MKNGAKIRKKWAHIRPNADNDEVNILFIFDFHQSNDENSE
jgi:hypothetical protein